MEGYFMMNIREDGCTSVHMTIDIRYCLYVVGIDRRQGRRSTVALLWCRF